MSILLYSMRKGDAGRRLQKVVKRAVPGEETERYETIEALSERLRQQHYDLTAAVLLISSDADLISVLSLRDLLENVPVILVLPADDNSLWKNVHELRPRFTSYDDDNFSDVAEVLKKMAGSYYKKYSGRERPNGSDK